MRRLIRGYRKRGRLQAELLRLCAYHSCYAFRKNEEGKLPHEWLTLPWEIEGEKKPQEVSEEEAEELQNLMRSAQKGELFGDSDKLEGKGGE